MIKDLASALNSLHTMKIAHGGLHPRNVLLTSDNRVLLSAFDVSKTPVRCHPEYANIRYLFLLISSSCLIRFRCSAWRARSRTTVCASSTHALVATRSTPPTTCSAWECSRSGSSVRPPPSTRTTVVTCSSASSKASPCSCSVSVAEEIQESQVIHVTR